MSTAVDPATLYDLGHQGDVDSTQVEKMLRLTPAERLERHFAWAEFFGGRIVDPKFIAEVVRRLREQQVEYIIVGAVCAMMHGALRPTIVLDICYRRTPENIRRLAAALSPLKPRPRGFPEGLPFVFEERTIQLGSNFTLDIGGVDLDLLGTMSAVGGYEEVIERAVRTLLPNGEAVSILSLEDLIATKEAANRGKDHNALPELRELRNQKRAHGTGT